MLRSRLCDYNDAYMLVKGNISVNDTAAEGAAENNTNKKVIFKNCAPFTNCISKINYTEIDNAKDNDVVMPMYNLIEYSDNYSKTSGSLWQYCKDIPAVNNNGNIINFNGTNAADSFNFKTTFITHEKKLKELMCNVVLPFTPAETVLNLSGIRLKHSIEPLHINKTDVLTTFDFIHRSISKDFKYEKDAGEAKAKMSYLANNYVNTYKPSKNILCKHKIIKNLRNNKDILITNPEKGNEVIIVNRAIYMSKFI